MKRHKIESHSLEILEFEQIRQILSSFTVSELGAVAARQLYPSTDSSWISQRLDETSQFKLLIEQGQRCPLSGLHDLTVVFEQMTGKQTVFEPQQLLKIAETLDASGRLKNFLNELDSTELGQIKTMASHLAFFDDLVNQIFRTVGEENSLKDEASEKLMQIRRTIRDINQQIQEKFRGILSQPDMSKAIEIDRFLTRNGRAVIAINANYRQSVKGIVLDRSRSGATLFVEPYDIMELSNSLEQAISEEKKEEWRVLWELTHIVSEQKKQIIDASKGLSFIDLAVAKAEFSLAYHMTAPQVKTDGSLNLRQARHPLLLKLSGMDNPETRRDALKKIIPIDIRLGDDFDQLVVTGSNTGGKTAMLKTVGLLNLMAQSGLHITADAESQVPIYRQVFVDIGDEQNLQQSLSTFSSHIQQLVNIIKKANQRSLVLLDELCSGTDPAEGAPLGIAILNYLKSLEAKVIVTTHLGRLKEYAYSQSRVENGSVVFDGMTLKPTYELLIGTPGTSHALNIAQRLGVPSKIIKDAKVKLEQKDQREKKLFSQVQALRVQTEEKHQQTHALLEQAKAVQRVALERLEVSKQQQAKLQQRADEEIQQTMLQVQKLCDQYTIEMQNAPKLWKDTGEAFIKQLSQQVSQTNLAQRQAAFLEKVSAGDRVYVDCFSKNAVIEKIRRKKESAVVLIDGKQLEVPLKELWQAMRDS